MERFVVADFGFVVELEVGIVGFVDRVGGMLGRKVVVDLCSVEVCFAVVLEVVAVELGQGDAKRKMTALMYQIADLLVQGLGSY